jgi:hypothetical protein
MLETLEGRLADPLGGQQALVFYQLRDLWKSGSELLRGLIAELAGQHEDRERRLFLSDFNRRQFEKRQEVEHALNIAQIAAADVRAKLTELQKAHKAASRWWHYFKRRDLDRRIHAMAAEAQGTRDSLAEARAAHDVVANVQPPEFPGLSIEARRTINLTAIAYAEVLALRLARTPLLQMAAEAWRRRDPGSAYADVATCTALMTQIARAKLALAGRGTASVDVKQRGEQLRQRAKYRSNAEVVPTEDSVAAATEPALASAVTGQAPQGATPQVLREDHWDLRRLLLR